MNVQNKTVITNIFCNGKIEKTKIRYNPMACGKNVDFSTLTAYRFRSNRRGSTEKSTDDVRCLVKNRSVHTVSRQSCLNNSATTVYLKTLVLYGTQCVLYNLVLSRCSKRTIYFNRRHFLAISLSLTDRLP